MVTAKDGQLYRLNAATGEIARVTESGLRPLTDDLAKLRVGDYYEMSDVTSGEKYLKYLGNGQFEKSLYAIRDDGK
jgi:ribosomal protein S6